MISLKDKLIKQTNDLIRLLHQISFVENWTDYLLPRRKLHGLVLEGELLLVLLETQQEKTATRGRYFLQYKC